MKELAVFQGTLAILQSVFIYIEQFVYILILYIFGSTSCFEKSTSSMFFLIILASSRLDCFKALQSLLITFFSDRELSGQLTAHVIISRVLIPITYRKHSHMKRISGRLVMWMLWMKSQARPGNKLRAGKLLPCILYLRVMAPFRLTSAINSL